MVRITEIGFAWQMKRWYSWLGCRGNAVTMKREWPFSGEAPSVEGVEVLNRCVAWELNSVLCSIKSPNWWWKLKLIPNIYLFDNHWMVSKKSAWVTHPRVWFAVWDQVIELFYFFNGEFDSGSGRTLAACLTHASRTMKPSLLGGLVANGWVIRE